MGRRVRPDKFPRVQTKLEELRLRLAEISDLGGRRRFWTGTSAPDASGRGAEPAASSRRRWRAIRHERLISDELGAALEAAGGDRGAAVRVDEASLVRVARREWEKARRVPAELAGGDHPGVPRVAEHAWVEARERSDFAAFLPYLERNVELRRRYAECFEGFDGFEHPYDPLLDDFEPG